MSCRENPASSALVTLCPRVSNLREGQVQSVFHDLKRDAAEHNPPAPTEQEYQAFLRSLDGSLTEFDRRAVSDRLSRAAEEGVPDGATYLAMTQLRTQTVLARKALDSALRGIGRARLGDLSQYKPHNHRMLTSAAVRAATARYDAFREEAEKNRNLRAPDGYAQQIRDSSRSRAALPKDRITAYALWRTSTTGADFAPPPPAGTTYVSQVASFRDMRPGDVLDEPGYRDFGHAAHEGKVVNNVQTEGHRTTVTFTDGSSLTQSGGVFTVLRPRTPEQEAQLNRYRAAQLRAREGGQDATGKYVIDPDTGERVYQD